MPFFQTVFRRLTSWKLLNDRWRWVEVYTPVILTFPRSRRKFWDARYQHFHGRIASVSRNNGCSRSRVVGLRWKRKVRRSQWSHWIWVDNWDDFKQWKMYLFLFHVLMAWNAVVPWQDLNCSSAFQHESISENKKRGIRIVLASETRRYSLNRRISLGCSDILYSKDVTHSQAWLGIAPLLCSLSVELEHGSIFVIGW